MSEPSTPKPVKLIVSLLFGDEGLVAPVAGRLSQAYGGIDFVSKRLPFDKTDYYETEMGKDLVRRFVTFEQLMQPDVLPEVKRYTDALESEYRDREGNRKVNLDPGYLSLGPGGGSCPEGGGDAESAQRLGADCAAINRQALAGDRGGVGAGPARGC